MTITDEKRAELLMDHYKDTFQHILYHWKVRNRLFIFVLILLAIMALDTYSPGSLSKLINGYIAKKYEIGSAADPAFEFKVIGSAAWFLLLSLVINYYQRSIFVDRQYNYIHNLENQINTIMGSEYVTREGKAYFSKKGVASDVGKQPILIRAVGPLYVYLFPLLLFLFIGYKIYSEEFNPKSFTYCFNLFVGVLILLYTFYYVVWVKFRR